MMDKDNLGLGVMINMLGGNEESVKAHNDSIDRTIKALILKEKRLKIDFTDNTRLTIFDDGQSCCEHRYMNTDDDLDYFIGATFKGAEIKDAPSPPQDEYEVHDIQFLEVKTDKGVFTIENHNGHNGRYGGFSIVCKHDKFNY